MFCTHRAPLFGGVPIVALQSQCGLWAIPSCPCPRSRSAQCRRGCPGGHSLWGWQRWAPPPGAPSSCPCGRRSARPRHPHLPPSACGSHGCSHLRAQPHTLPTPKPLPTPRGETPPPSPPACMSRGPQSSCPGWGGGGSLAALPQLMLHLGTGIYPLAQLGAINSCWDGRQGCSGCQHQPSTGLRGSSQSPADPHPPHRPTVLAVMGLGCPILSPMGAHLPPGGVSLPPPAPPKILALLWAL